MFKEQPVASSCHPVQLRSTAVQLVEQQKAAKFQSLVFRFECYGQKCPPPAHFNSCSSEGSAISGPLGEKTWAGGSKCAFEGYP